MTSFPRFLDPLPAAVVASSVERELEGAAPTLAPVPNKDETTTAFRSLWGPVIGVDEADGRLNVLTGLTKVALRPPAGSLLS